MLLAHLSDPHLGPLPEPRLHELASKRLFGYLNWRSSRGAVLVNDTLTRLTDDIADQTPDHIAVTGDLVNLSLNAELPMARAWLGELGRPHDVSIVPGNHDAYVPGALKRVHTDWRDYMCGDHGAHADDPETVAEDHPTSAFPYVRKRPPVALVGVSTARATPPLMATGHFDATQALRLKDTLDHLRHEGFFRIVLIHHPPVRERNDWYRRLIGASRFRAAIAAAGAELILHGHNHRAGIRFIDGPKGDVPVVGVPAASQRPDGNGRGGRYNLFAIGGEAGKWRCTMTERGLVHPGHDVTPIAHHTLYGPPGADFALPA